MAESPSLVPGWRTKRRPTTIGGNSSGPHKGTVGA